MIRASLAPTGLLLLGSLLAATGAQAAELTDVATARQRAAKSGKPVLIDFSSPT